MENINDLCKDKNMKRFSLIIIYEIKIKDKSHLLKKYLRSYITVYQAKLYIPGYIIY